jgi:outer membrane protein assembly factor BamB
MKPAFATLLLWATFQIGGKDSSGLLNSWPDTGPQLVFKITGIGNGYSSPAVGNDQLIVTGETDSTGYLFAYDLKGNLLWKRPYGEEFTVSFPGSRAAPRIVDNLVYIASGTGDIHCFDSKTGAKKWTVSFTRDLGGINPIFGYSMPVVIDGEKLFCSPSGEKNNVVALNRFTGDLIWSSPARGEPAGYGSPLLIDLPERKILVTSSEYNILGLDAQTGELLWNYELAFKGDIPCNTPVFDGKNLYWIAGPGNGAVAASLSPDGRKIKVKWKNIEFDTSFGDFVQIGGYLYGSSNRLRKFVSVNARTGKAEKDLPFGTGATILAGYQIIAYNQRGQVGLIRPEEGKLKLVSSFKITSGTQEHFSHPVIFNGRLYIRHGDALLAYNITTNE